MLSAKLFGDGGSSNSGLYRGVLELARGQEQSQKRFAGAPNRNAMFTRALSVRGCTRPSGLSQAAACACPWSGLLILTAATPRGWA